MGARFLVDSNVVIEFLGELLPELSSERMEDIVDHKFHSLSVINQIEILGFNGPDEEMRTLEEFVKSSVVLPISDEVVQKTIELRKAHKIKLPDAMP
jgi:hypothetical protein